MLHPNVSMVSYLHRYKISKTFKELLGFLDITHLSLDLVRPDGELIFFSSTPSHGYELCTRGFGKYNGTVDPAMYQNNEFYWWSDVKHKKFAREINYINEVSHEFREGFMMVRHWDDFYLVYSFASNRNDRKFKEEVKGRLNEIFKLADYIYNEMRDIYGEYCGDYVPPVIDAFYPYQGGKPVPRFSNQYKETHHNIVIAESIIERQSTVIKEAKSIILTDENE